MAPSSNPLYASQWHFNLIGDIETIWSEFTGAGINVGVYEGGTERTHADLAANYRADLELSTFGDNGQPASNSDYHGTAVAGIIAAADNSVGGVGVAFDASITGVNYLDYLQNLPGSSALDSLAAASRFDVMNNSWGIDPDYSSYRNLGDVTSDAFAMANALADAASAGRGGLGTIVVKAAGNEANDSAHEAVGLFGSAQGDGLNSAHELILVSATRSDGFVADYSNWGANILVSAPAASVSTDLTGVNGASFTDYINIFGGTSAATPVVSGVAALMLDANPNLGWRDVQQIIAFSAGQTGSAYGSAGSGFEVGDWFANGATNWNGGGKSFHLSYGFGMVDAFAAVRMAEVWSKFVPVAQTSANTVVTTASYTAPVYPILDNSTASLPILIGGSDLIAENATLRLFGSHTYSGDLDISLVAPTGESYSLFLREGNSSLVGDWTFGVRGILGTYALGTWTVVINDNAAGDTGQITRADLTIEGHAYSADTVYHYTDDFATYAAVDSARQTLNDIDGGNDWINMAALTGNVNVSLLASGTATVSGSNWLTLSNGDLIENIATGDGNDSIVGNTLNNEILGGRGGDDIMAGFGADTVDGGAGADSLVAAEGNDLVYGGTGNDTIFGNTGVDVIYAGADHDYVSAGAGADTIYGGTGYDTLYGRSGVDVIFGDAGDDSIIGSEGADTLNGNDGNDIMYGGSAWDVLFGGDGNDTLFGNFGSDVLSGGVGADELVGGSGDDTLRGGDGNDIIQGNQGRDSIEGGAGNDTLRGGTLADRFIFNTGFDADVIEDFEHWQDSLRIYSAVVGGAMTGQQVINQFASAVGADVILNFGSGMMITLEGLNSATVLTANSELADNIFIL